MFQCVRLHVRCIAIIESGTAQAKDPDSFLRVMKTSMVQVGDLCSTSASLRFAYEAFEQAMVARYIAMALLRRNVCTY